MTTPPADGNLPVRLSRAKEHVRVTGGHDDTYIKELLIPAAALFIEQQTGRQLINATYLMTLDCFPSGAIALPKSPVLPSSTVVIRYYNSDGNLTVLDPASYSTALRTEPGEVRHWKYSSWPLTESRRSEAVEIEFVAGYGADSDSVPELLQAAILLLVGHWYEHREQVVVGASVNELPMAVSNIITQFRVGDEFVNYAVGV